MHVYTFRAEGAEDFSGKNLPNRKFRGEVIIVGILINIHFKFLQ